MASGGTPAILLHRDDNVVVASRSLPQGMVLDIQGTAIPLKQQIDLGHKVAIKPIPAKAPIRKFGQTIGFATTDIAVPAEDGPLTPGLVAAGDFDREFRRKVRIVNRAWRAMMSLKDLLNPFRHGFFTLEIVSHKVLRWLVPLFLLICLLANLALLREGGLYVFLLAGQVLFYALAAVGHARRLRGDLPRALALPYYFVMVNLASARGILEAYWGRTYTTWTPPRAS